jgi:hypothetical protein
MSFTTNIGGMLSSVVGNIAFNNSPQPLGVLPANATIHNLYVDVGVAFAGTAAPTISIGTAASQGLFASGLVVTAVGRVVVPWEAGWENPGGGFDIPVIISVVGGTAVTAGAASVKMDYIS